MYSDFLTFAMDPIVNQAAKLRYMFGGQVDVPMVVRTNLGASGGKAAQHSQSLESWFMHMPGLHVAVPTSPADAKGLLKTAIRDDNPVIFLEHKSLYFTRGHVPDGETSLVPFGAARVRREGTDVTVVATHAMLHQALAAAEKLAAEGIELEVIDPRTLVPLDIETIVRVRRAHEPAARLPRGARTRRLGRRDRDAGRRARLRLPRRAGRPGVRGERPGAVQREPRAHRRPSRRAGRGRRASLTRG